MITEEQVLEALSNVDDPDLNKDIVSLGMVKDVKIDGLKVNFTVVLTTPACPMKDMIHKACVNAIIHYVNTSAIVEVNMTANVTTSSNSTRKTLGSIKNIIAVSSGKGGVGKSTIACNLAIALAMKGAKVGLVDADIYGPSQTIMFDIQNQRPGMTSIEGKNYMTPVESYGVKIMSIGFFAETNQAVAWRGPMATKATTQMFFDTYWGALDYLIVDLPPGTGDIHLSIAQSIPLNGAIIVSTPQAIALADTKKGVAMFRMDAFKIPILGIVENMAYFTPAELPQNKYYIFGKEGASQLAETLDVALLAQIPLVIDIREGADVGSPAVTQLNTLQSQIFLDLASSVAQKVSVYNLQSATVSA
jgi:ATP-binding protein involved in chromosome partitioning